LRATRSSDNWHDAAHGASGHCAQDDRANSGSRDDAETVQQLHASGDKLPLGGPVVLGTLLSDFLWQTGT
jgi:hypothetical protein